MSSVWGDAIGFVGLMIAIVGAIGALVLLFGMLALKDYETPQAQQDARICSMTPGCDVSQAEARVADLEAAEKASKATAWRHAGIMAIIAAAGGLACVGAGLFLEIPGAL